MYEDMSAVTVDLTPDGLLTPEDRIADTRGFVSAPHMITIGSISDEELPGTVGSGSGRRRFAESAAETAANPSSW